MREWDGWEEWFCRGLLTKRVAWLFRTSRCSLEWSEGGSKVNLNIGIVHF